MAKLAHIEARKAQAMQDTAASVEDLHRKLDIIMAKLGIVDIEAEQPETPVTVTEAAPPAPEQPEDEADPKAKASKKK